MDKQQLYVVKRITDGAHAEVRHRTVEGQAHARAEQVEVCGGLPRARRNHHDAVAPGA